MAFDTYAGLVTTVADWLHRSDLSAQVPDFIRMAELVINRRLNIFPREIEAPLAAVIGSRFVPLPTDFGQPVDLWILNDDPRRLLTPVQPDQLPVNDSMQGLPNFWAIDGANIAFEFKADQAYPLAFRYVENLFLSNANQTHATFLRAPDLYVYGALAQAAPYIRDDERLAMWEQKFKTLLFETAADAGRAKGFVPLRTEIPEMLCRPYPSRRRY
jgi:hypothetical protein